MDHHRCLPVPGEHVVLIERTLEQDDLLQPVLPNQAFETLLQHARPDDAAAQAATPLAQDRAGTDQIVEPLFLDQSSNGQDERRTGGTVSAELKPMQIGPVVETPDPDDSGSDL